MLSFSFLAIALYNTGFTQAKKPIVFCYLTASAAKRNFPGTFTVRDADTEHCTHIAYAFMGLNNETSEIRSRNEKIDYEEGGGQLNELKLLKTINPDIKILASVGGYCEGSVKFSEMARSSTRKTAFINSLIKFTKEWELDGIDMCWQFPAQRGGVEEDKRNFINLLSDLKRVFMPKEWLLTVHIMGKQHIIDQSYDMKSISMIVDYINLAAFGYHRSWFKSTGIFSPLRSDNEKNVEYMVDYTIQKGAAPSKILLGLPTHGQAYLVEEKIQRGQYLELYSNQTYKSQGTNHAGLIAYYEICYDIRTSDGWNEEWDQESSTPVAYNNKKFVSYEDERSLLEKVRLVTKYNLGGIMLWSLDMDDFIGLCDKRYPLLSAVTDYLKNVEKASTPKKSKASNEK